MVPVASHVSMEERGIPALVYCSISAYGQTGPRADEGGFAMTLQAMAELARSVSVPGQKESTLNFRGG